MATTMTSTNTNTNANIHPVPLFYRILFTYIDPFFCTFGLIAHVFDPLNTLTGYSINASFPPSVETVHLLDSMAGFFALLGTLEAVLLRVRGRDTTVWRVVQASASLLDWFMVYAAVRALSADGRLEDWSAWRGDDWRLVAGNISAGVFRTACALGIGFGGTTMTGGNAAAAALSSSEVLGGLSKKDE